MKNEDLKAITDSIEEKIGKENSGIIADDLGKLFTLNKQTIDSINKLESEKADLISKNDKLIVANGNLLQQIPMEKEPEKEKEEEYKPFNYRSIFDEKGNIKR